MSNGLFDNLKGRKLSIGERFAIFHRENPQVYRLFVELCEKVLNAGHTKYSARGIFNQIRWHYEIEAKRDGGFKLNDHYSPRYARMLAAEDVRFNDFFEFRDLRAA